MKQHITKKQWNELGNKDRKEKLLEFLNEKFGKDTNEYITIGQMIEFLEEKSDIGFPFQEIVTIEKGHWECFNGWQVTFWKSNPPRCSECNQIRSNHKETQWSGQSWDNLCDALWEAVKEKLKE